MLLLPISLFIHSLAYSYSLIRSNQIHFSSSGEFEQKMKQERVIALNKQSIYVFTFAPIL